MLGKLTSTCRSEAVCTGLEIPELRRILSDFPPLDPRLCYNPWQTSDLSPRPHKIWPKMSKLRKMTFLCHWNFSAVRTFSLAFSNFSLDRFIFSLCILYSRFLGYLWYDNKSFWGKIVELRLGRSCRKSLEGAAGPTDTLCTFPKH